MPRIAPACSLGLVAVGGDLDPARLAAPADQHLGLDRAGVADPLRRGDGVLDGGGDLAARHGDAVRGEQLLALILEEVHVEGALPGAGGSLSEIASAMPSAAA